MNLPMKKTLSLFSKDLPYFLKRRLLYIIDSNVAGDKRFCLDLLSLLKEFDLLWYGHAPVSIAFDQKLLEGFAQSGCIAINIGFESFSTKNLNAMGKGFNQPSRYAEAVEKIHDRGIGIMGTFIVGLDDDDPGSSKGSSTFALTQGSTGLLPSSWPLILEPIHFCDWRKKEGFFAGIGKNTIPSTPCISLYGCPWKNWKKG